MIKIFADGADLAEMLQAYASGEVAGFTTNPTLMRKAGVTDYEAFAREVLGNITDVPVSLEVFADDLQGMYEQAVKLSGWGPNVYVKVPVTNTQGVDCAPSIRRLAAQGVKLNITAVLTSAQVERLAAVLSPQVPSIVSIFAGRIADTGVDPMPIMRQAVDTLRPCGAQVLWASPREVLNVYQAEACGCHIVTLTGDLTRKLALRHKDLEELSRETVQMFHSDAMRAGYRI